MRGSSACVRPREPWHRAPGAAGVRVWPPMSRLTGTSGGATRQTAFVLTMLPAHRRGMRRQRARRAGSDHSRRRGRRESCTGLAPRARQFLDQSALADPRLSEDRNQLARSGVSLVKRRMDLLEGRVAANERSVWKVCVEPCPRGRPRGRARHGAGGPPAGGHSLPEDVLIEQGRSGHTRCMLIRPAGIISKPLTPGPPRLEAQ